MWSDEQSRGNALCPEPCLIWRRAGSISNYKSQAQTLNSLDEAWMAHPPFILAVLPLLGLPHSLEKRGAGRRGAVSSPYPPICSRGLRKSDTCEASGCLSFPHSGQLGVMLGAMVHQLWSLAGAEPGSRRAASSGREHGKGSEPPAWPSPSQAHVPRTTVDVFLRREAWYFPPPPPQCLSGCLTPAWERKDTSADIFKTRQLSTRWLTAPRSLNLS